MTFVLLALGGVVGALGRYHGTRWVQSRISSAFPLGTFLVNLSGCWALGLLTGVLLAHPDWPGRELSLLLGTGVCGAYTTFSSFAFETMQLWRQGQRRQALYNGLAQPLLGCLCVWLGLALGRAIG